jgi:hypothetical protein
MHISICQPGQTLSLTQRYSACKQPTSWISNNFAKTGSPELATPAEPVGWGFCRARPPKANAKVRSKTILAQETKRGKFRGPNAVEGPLHQNHHSAIPVRLRRRFAWHNNLDERVYTGAARPKALVPPAEPAPDRMVELPRISLRSDLGQRHNHPCRDSAIRGETVMRRNYRFFSAHK